MRESLFEKLKKQNIVPLDELNKIVTVIEKSSSIQGNLRYYFKKTKYSVYFVDFDVAMSELFDTNPTFLKDEYNNIKDKIRHCRYGDFSLSLDSFLDYLVLLKTILETMKLEEWDSNLDQLQNIIDFDAQRVGYTFVIIDKEARLKIINPIAEAVALNVSKETSSKIEKYLSIRSGNVEEKRSCIKSLADDVEMICKTYSSTTEYNKLKQFIQCVRHTKEKPIKEFPFYYANEERWLDKIFDMIIGILSFTKTKEIVKEICDKENTNNSRAKSEQNSKFIL